MPRRPSSAALRRALVEELERQGMITERAVRRAFLAVRRDHFLPATELADVYANKVVVVRTDASGMATSSSSQPSIMALMLERLELAPGLRVLEIGAGSGYNAALLSTLVGAKGEVLSVELDADLAEAAATALASGGYRARVVTGDGRDGWPAGAPYDRIILTASAPTVFRPWFDQLAPGGLLQLPLHLKGPDLQAVVTLRKEDGALRSASVVEGGFMRLRGPGAGSPRHQGAGVSIGTQVDGSHESLGSLSGDGLRRLSPAGRRRLAAVMLEKPRVRTVAGPSGVGRSPALWLQLARPRGAVVARYHRSGLEAHGHFGVGVSGLDGRSLAVAVCGGGRGIRLESYGDGAALDVLDGLVERWAEVGRPGTRDLQVSVSWPAGDDGPAKTALRWPGP